MLLRRARLQRRVRPVRRAMEQVTGWYFTRSIEGYRFLQTGELPRSVLREGLKIALARLRRRRLRVSQLMRLRKTK